MSLSFSISLSNTGDLIDFAKRFLIDDRLNSLENDIYRCLPRDGDKKETTSYAPFPALLYCFSIIDLLGGLYAGNCRSGNTTKNSEAYMEDFLKYTPDKIFLLQKLYRHKVVHLSQPKSVILYNKQNIAWRHDENQRSKHLTIDPTPGKKRYLVIRKLWPGMLMTLWQDDDKYRDTYWKKFENVYYTGDYAIVDNDGYFWILGRVDDILKVSGHRFSTAELESVFLANKEVAEAAVTTKYDGNANDDIIVAFLVLKTGFLVSDQLRTKTIDNIRSSIGQHSNSNVMNR
jgi:acyl-CoA synthetase (AMP-forming)/AMP-acid ligase II